MIVLNIGVFLVCIGVSFCTGYILGRKREINNKEIFDYDKRRKNEQKKRSRKGIYI